MWLPTSARVFDLDPKLDPIAVDAAMNSGTIVTYNVLWGIHISSEFLFALEDPKTAIFLLPKLSLSVSSLNKSSCASSGGCGLWGNLYSTCFFYSLSYFNAL